MPIWLELELGGTTGLVERVAQRVGADIEMIEDDVEHVVGLLAESDLLISSRRPGALPGSTQIAQDFDHTPDQMIDDFESNGPLPT